MIVDYYDSDISIGKVTGGIERFVKRFLKDFGDLHIVRGFLIA